MNILWAQTSMINCRVHLRQHHHYEHTMNSYQHDMPRPPLIQSVKSGKRHTKWRSHRSIHYFHTNFADNYIYIPCALKAGCHSHTSHKICQVCRSICALLFTACTPCDWVYRLSIRIKRYLGHPFSHVPPRGPVQQIRYVDLSPISPVPPMELAGSRTGQKGKTVYSCWTAVLCICSHFDISVTHAADTHH